VSETDLPILILDEDADAIAAALVEAGLPVGRLRPVTGAPGPEHADTRIALAAPDRMVAHADALPALEWVQSTWAGIRPLLPLMAERPELVVTGVKGVFGPLMAEYLFGWLAALERGLLDYPALQARRRWQPLPQRRMAGRRMTLIGLGSIGAHLARVARSAFDLRVTGVSRSGRPVEDVERVFPVEELAEAAAGADYLVSVVPDTEATRGLIDARVLSALARDAILINVGRGSVLEDAALIAALPERRPRAAVLDVFREEPLPEDDPLWTTPGVHITPHVAATTLAADIARLFLANLERREAGQEPAGRVDPARGY
jgi:phosphoglycerate dehydrogenase-like enzyme